MKIKERFLTTGIGSLPYLDPVKSAREVCAKFDIPFWPQLPKRGFKENMYVQYASGLPALIIDENKKKVYIDTTKDLSEGLGRIFEAYLSNDYTSFGLGKDFAQGFYEFLDIAGQYKPNYIKGHVTGPVSFGLGLVDEKGKSILYNDTLKEAFIKLLEIKAAYQIDKLKEICKNIIVFIDEPYLTSFGSSYVNIQKQDVIAMLNAVIDKIKSKGVLSGIHCCGNTDWSVLTETRVDIINFDAYSYAEGLSLYPEEISGFLKKGGILAWGIIPTSESVLKETEESLFNRLTQEIGNLEKKKVPRNLLLSNSLLTPSCGMGTLSQDLTEDIIKKLTLVSRLAKDNLAQ
ncbi:MAG: methionine synthase [Candidatus Omnitrophica bacterium]|nr:methionine synthase [Candidatus Omnitrophota bacterium]